MPNLPHTDALRRAVSHSVLRRAVSQTRRAISDSALRRAVTHSALLGLIAIGACTSSEPADRPSDPATDTYAASLGINLADFTKRADGLYVRDLVVGTGAEATNGKTIRVQYTGWLPNGQQFETNVGDAPYPVVLGTGGVIAGWDQGLLGMKVGGKRRLLVGSSMAYGRTGRGPIPPNSTIIFDVEVVSVQ